jgi:uncharacterized protein
VSWPAPVAGPDTAAFWAHTAARELRLQRCDACGTLRHPPAPVCFACWSPAATWELMSGAAELRSWVVYRRRYHDAFPVPFTVGLVELAEGPRLNAPLLGDPGDGLRSGLPLRLAWTEREGFTIPGFEPEVQR